MAAVLALAGCQPVATVPKPARGGTAVEALVGQPSVLNPLFETNASTRDVDNLIYQGLTTVDSQQNVVGVLAQDWSVSPDHLTYTFNVRSGVMWGDGQPSTPCRTSSTSSPAPMGGVRWAWPRAGRARWCSACAHRTPRSRSCCAWGSFPSTSS